MLLLVYPTVILITQTIFCSKVTVHKSPKFYNNKCQTVVNTYSQKFQFALIKTMFNQ